MALHQLEPELWAELKCALGDSRRTRRLVGYAAGEAPRASRSTSSACSGDDTAAEGAYRLVRNPSVAADAITEGGFQATVEAAFGSPTILALEDSTTLTFRHSVAVALGSIGGATEPKVAGFCVHSVLLVDADAESTIGLVHQHRWTRDPSALRGSKIWRRPTGPKESEKWELASACTADRMGSLMPRVISVCDREADIFQYIAFKVNKGQRFVVRSCNDRLTMSSRTTLWSDVRRQNSMGKMSIAIEQRGGVHARPRRTANLSIRAKRVTSDPRNISGTSAVSA
jgi:hypothetical protein